MRKLKEKEPFGTISGVFETHPEAKYIQNGAYFGTTKRYLCDFDGVDRSPDTQKPEDEEPQQVKASDILGVPAKTFIESIDTIPTVDDLTKLIAAEKQGDNRKTVLAALEDEILERTEAGDE